MLELARYFAQACEATGNDIIGSQCLPQTEANSDTLNTIFMIVFITIGALATLFMVIAGIRYITAGGDPQKIQTARNEIKYGLIGLVIAGMGAAIVNYVIELL